MAHIHHLNCLQIITPVYDDVIGHCLLIEEKDQLILVDTGIGLEDTRNPEERVGRGLIEAAGFRFNESRTAVSQIRALGLDPRQVKHCVISHLDIDHISGIIDFPEATVHVGLEEYESFRSHNQRYSQVQLAHNPPVRTYAASAASWLGLEARRIDIPGEAELYFIPLFGHTKGHCGVAIKNEGQWLFYIGDAYYLKAELSDPEHPVHEFAAMRAEDKTQRLETLDTLRRLVNGHPGLIMFGYHDREEFRPFSKN